MNEHVKEVNKILFVELSNCGERDDSLKNAVAKNNLFRTQISETPSKKFQ